MNKLIEQFDSLTESPKKNLGFGNNSPSSHSKKLLVSAESTSIDTLPNSFDSILIKDLEFNSIKKIKQSSNLSVGILNPDKNIKLKSVENAGFDYVILKDLNLSSEFLSSEKLSIGYQVTNSLDDDLSDVIDELPFSFIYVDLILNPDLSNLSGIFKIANITTKISKNIFLKLSSSPSISTLNLLSTLGVNSIVFDQNVAPKIKLDELNLNINKIKSEVPKNSRHYADISTAITDIDVSEDDY